jgi:hypothetical protein
LQPPRHMYRCPKATVFNVVFKFVVK